MFKKHALVVGWLANYFLNWTINPNLKDKTFILLVSAGKYSQVVVGRLWSSHAYWLLLLPASGPTCRRHPTSAAHPGCGSSTDPNSQKPLRPSAPFTGCQWLHACVAKHWYWRTMLGADQVRSTCRTRSNRTSLIAHSALHRPACCSFTESETLNNINTVCCPGC